MRTKKPFVVAWNRNYLKLSDGSQQKEFLNHDEAIRFVEEEIRKVTHPLATRKSRSDYLEKYGAEPVLGQIQCTREVRNVCLLYGVSDYYIVPSKAEIECASDSKS